VRDPERLSGRSRMVFTLMTPRAIKVAEPFHLGRLANAEFDECRRRCSDLISRADPKTVPYVGTSSNHESVGQVSLTQRHPRTFHDR
jgi:hypothetical protein